MMNPELTRYLKESEESILSLYQNKPPFPLSPKELHEGWKPITGTQWLGILWLGVVIDAVAYLLWALSLKDVGNTAKIANLAYLTPFLSLIISAVTFKNGIEPNEVIALVFIVGGILLQSFWDTLRRNA